MSEPERYTLDEARALLAKRECASHGHFWDVIETVGRPLCIVCDTCGVSYGVCS